ncbi:hypothetical protein [Clostridium tagluense]|uniref:hypothetical protein n=1 Tax=Clostridium tagluense TaxID=360422 RepID=UPI001C0E4361|nr:hypothetical protein [Clostridium tagluense]MBU3130688.1 hypothetical protein [Clostridium tagluense]
MKHLFSNKIKESRDDVRGYGCWFFCDSTCSGHCTGSCNDGCINTCKGQCLLGCTGWVTST